MHVHDPEPSSEQGPLPPEEPLVYPISEQDPASGRLATFGAKDRLVERAHVFPAEEPVECGRLGRLWCPPAPGLVAKQMYGHRGQRVLPGGEGYLASR